MHRRFQKSLYGGLCTAIEFLIGWCFPLRYKSHRTAPFLESLLAVMMACRSLLWIRGHFWSDQGQRILRLFSPDQQRALCCLGELRERRLCLADLVWKQIHFFHTGTVSFGLYPWRGPSWSYVGIGSLTRKSLGSQGGLSHRLLEHLMGTIKKDTRDGQKLRYRLARRHVPLESHFCICDTGSEMFIRARESLEIITHRPSANGMPAQQAQRPVNRSRSRPRKRMTKGCIHIPSDIAHQCLDKHFDAALQKQRRQARGDERTCSIWELSFVEAYRRYQKQCLCELGQIGPVFLYHLCCVPLLLLFMTVASSSDLRWDLAEKSDSLIGIRLALLMRKLKKPYQKNRVRILLDPWLRRHGSFDTKIVHLHVDHPDLCIYTRNIVTTCASG